MTLRNATAGISTKAYQQPNAGNRPSNFVLYPNAPAQFWQPAWGGKNTTIRMLPAVDPDNPGQFLPARVADPSGETDSTVFSPWIYRLWMLRRFGDPKVVLAVADDSCDTNEVLAQSPGSVLRKAVLRAIDRRAEKPGWGGLVNGTKAVLTPTKLCCLVQCFLFRWNSKSYISIPGKTGKQPPRGARPDDPVVVMLLPPSAANALMRAMDTDGGLPWQQDPVGIHPGAFVHIFERGADPIRAPGATSADVYSSKPVEESAGGDQFKGYDIDLSETLDGLPMPNDIDASLAGREQLVASKVRPWDKLVQIRSYEDQLRILARSFLTCPDRSLRDILVDVTKYAFEDQTDILPDEIRDYGKKTVQVPTPKAPPRPAAAPTAPVAPTKPPVDDLYAAPVVDAGDEEVPEEAASSGGDSEQALGDYLQNGGNTPEEPAVAPPSPEDVKKAMVKATADAKARANARKVKA